MDSESGEDENDQLTSA